ncbi:MgtC/SapB family protein [Caloramator sp. E03]|nr:MgtC/SapB family protein [Caloramator sp. E03]
MLMFYRTCLKLFLAVILGGIVGYERQHKSRPAGLRTHILVCIGACLVQIISLDFSIINKGTEVDPMRLGAQVISGIGFLGAGTIIKEGASIKGLTTAASLWTVACIGLATGSGLYMQSILATFFIYIALKGFKLIEDKIGYDKREVSFEVVIDDDLGKIGFIGTNLGKLNVNISNIEINKKDEHIIIELNLKSPKNISNERIIKAFSDIPGIKRVSLL